jgi:hypothetical protein
MRLGRSRLSFAVLFAATALSLSAISAHAQSPYDGTWQVTINTQTGSCEPTASYPLTVTDGVVSASGQEVSGRVGREGVVKVNIRGVYANGQLNERQGSGRWNGASAGIPCSGRWVASRQ